MRPFTASLPMALLQARETAMRLFRPMLAHHHLTEQQWRVLRALTAASPRDAGELAEDTSLLPPSLSRILTKLENRELIQRSSDPDDHRRSLIALSEHGHELVRTIAPTSEALYTTIEEQFGVERLERLLGELHELAALDTTIHHEIAS